MLEQRSELSRQIQHFEEKIKWLKKEANRLNIILNNNTENSSVLLQENHSTFISNIELNRIRLASIYNAIRGTS